MKSKLPEIYEHHLRRMSAMMVMAALSRAPQQALSAYARAGGDVTAINEAASQLERIRQRQTALKAMYAPGGGKNSK